MTHELHKKELRGILLKSGAMGLAIGFVAPFVILIFLEPLLPNRGADSADWGFVVPYTISIFALPLIFLIGWPIWLHLSWKWVSSSWFSGVGAIAIGVLLGTLLAFTSVLAFFLNVFTKVVYEPEIWEIWILLFPAIFVVTLVTSATTISFRCLFLKVPALRGKLPDQALGGLWCFGSFLLLWFLLAIVYLVYDWLFLY